MATHLKDPKGKSLADCIVLDDEEEENSIIMELRKNCASLQEKFTKEEADKLAAMDSIAKEREARLDIEKYHIALSKELAEAQRVLLSSNQEISSLNDMHKGLSDMYKGLLDHCTSLEQYKGKLRTDLSIAENKLKHIEEEKAALRGQLKAIKQKDEIAFLRAELHQVKDNRDRLQPQVQTSTTDEDEDEDYSEKYWVFLIEEVKKLEANCSSQNNQIRILQKQLAIAEEKLLTRTEFEGQKKLINELENRLADAEFRIVEGEMLCEKLHDTILELKGNIRVFCRVRPLLPDDGGISTEGKAIYYPKSIETLRDSSALETRAEFEGQKKLINELENRLADAEFRIVEEERLRKKLHKTILELNGNIRVFCRVRPLLPDDGGSSTEGKVIYYPESIEMVGRGIDVVQCGQKHTFTFDQVFMPDATQDDVFVEISELVQSAMDGHKVCIFAYGQTGSGKTYTMMGRRGHPEHKGLIPRSLEQIFQTRQSLQPHGWRYEMQVSMMEIYNETIRDLLSTNPSSAIKKGANTDRAAGKQYAIRHDANGNVHVSDLTIVDVHSAEEVALLLYRAAQSRSVGKTRMNEQSSRSHFVFTLRIFGVHESTKQQVQGVLNLIDLAGSGRLSKSGATGDRMKETQAINKSLSSLNDVILALAKKEGHIPFRNSKLTCLLQPCLGGESKTLMFVNISPDLSSVGESLCSLRFAARVNSFEIGIRRRQTNIGPSDSRG